MRIQSITGKADDGLSMVEVVVSMTVMLTVMAIFTTGVLQVNRTMTKTESLSIAQSQVLVAFQRLDREVRYASAISDTASTGPDQYVEYLLADEGAGTCVQLRLKLSTTQLLRRQWTNGGTPAAGNWMVLVSSVGAGATPPFVFTAADPTFNYQRLQVSLVVTVGNGSSTTRRESQVSFSALNSPIDPNDANKTICTEGRAVA